MVRIRLDVAIDAPVDRVWGLVATPANTGRWYCAGEPVEIAFEPAPGGDFEERYRGEHPHDDLTGTVVAYTPPERLAVRRDTDGRFGPSDLIDITLREDAGRTTVVLEHTFTALPDGREREARAFYEPGWRAALERLRELSAGEPARSGGGR